jgi:hypothetical protein
MPAHRDARPERQAKAGDTERDARDRDRSRRLDEHERRPAAGDQINGDYQDGNARKTQQPSAPRVMSRALTEGEREHEPDD